MPDLYRIKNNVSKMVQIGAPEGDIDSYVSGEGVTTDQIKNYQPSAKEFFTQNLPRSAGQFAQGVGQYLTHPIGIDSQATINAGKALLGAVTHPGDVIKDIGQKYGGVENIKQTAYEDPVGTLADLSVFAGGGEALLGQAGKLAPRLAKGLEESAAKSYTKALGATTKAEKELASKVVPGLTEKKKIFATRGGLLEKAQQETEKAGEKLEVGYRELPKESRVDAGTVVKSIEEKQEALKVNGILPDVSKQHFDQLERVKNDFTTLAKDKDVSPQTLREIRQVYDKAIDSTKQGYKMTGRGGAKLNAQRVLANSIRREIAKKYPSISALNKEFSFWSNLGDLLETTAPKAKGIMSGAHGFVAEHIGSVKPYAGLFLNLGKVFSDNVLWNSTSGAVKSHLANLITKGKITQASVVVNRILSKAGQETGKAVKAVGQELKNLGKRGSTEASEEFIRNSTSMESNSLAAKNKAFNSFPKKEGYQIVYKPYGNKGKGFYYVVENRPSMIFSSIPEFKGNAHTDEYGLKIKDNQPAIKELEDHITSMKEKRISLQKEDDADTKVNPEREKEMSRLANQVSLAQDALRKAKGTLRAGD